jgi:hypothetical protein
MRRAFVILAAVIAFVVVVVAIAPASLAGVVLERESKGQLALADAEGTLWRGRATLTAARALRLPLAWSIDAWPLLRGELRLRIVPSTTTGSSPRAEITARPDSIALRDLDVMVSADIVTSLAPRSGVQTTGDIRFSTPSLDWTPTSLDGGARIDWQNARFTVGSDAGIGLGTVTALLTAAGDRMTGPVTNVGGEFDVRGTLSLAANSASAVTLAMTPRGGEPAQARMLSVSGNPGRTGWNVEYRAVTR